MNEQQTIEQWRADEQAVRQRLSRELGFATPEKVAGKSGMQGGSSRLVSRLSTARSSARQVLMLLDVVKRDAARADCRWLPQFGDPVPCMWAPVRTC
jgi:hypothetical protein